MQDQIIYDKAFSFDSEVSERFDDMLSRSIPDYENMRSLLYGVGSHFARCGDTVIDIGSSLGRGYQLFAEQGCNVISCDVSESMIQRQRDLFGKMKNVDIRLCDVVTDFPKEKASLVLSVLTLQFIPIEDRISVIKSISECLDEGSAAIVVEKVIGQTSDISGILIDEYYRLKAMNGYTKEQISSKRTALEHSMSPTTEVENKRMLLDSGFSHVETFWRFLNFAAFLAIK